MAYPGSRGLAWSQWCPSGLACLALSSPALEQALSKLAGLKTQELDPLEKGRSVEQPATHPSLTQVGSGIHIPRFLEVPWVLSCSFHDGRE